MYKYRIVHKRTDLGKVRYYKDYHRYTEEPCLRACRRIRRELGDIAWVEERLPNKKWAAITRCETYGVLREPICCCVRGAVSDESKPASAGLPG